MSAKRIKSTAPTINTRDKAEAELGQIRDLTITRMTLAAERDAEVSAIDDKYAHQLAHLDTQLKERTELLKGWAEAHPSEFTGKSITWSHGTLGWRIGNPTLKTITGWTWDRVLEKLHLRRREWIRSKEEVAKDVVLSERDQFPDTFLRELGMRVTQDEAFFVAPNVDATATRQTVTA